MHDYETTVCARHPPDAVMRSLLGSNVGSIAKVRGEQQASKGAGQGDGLLLWRECRGRRTLCAGSRGCNPLGGVQRR